MDLAIREGVVGGVRSDPAPSVPDTTDLPPEILERCRDLFGAIHREAMGKTFTELEELVLKRVVSLGQTVLESALAVHPLADPEKEGVCSGCHKRLRIQKEEQARTLPTRLGPISYNRPYAVCDRCQRSGAPMDHELGIPPLGVSIGLLEHVCHAAMVGRSFDDAREILEVHSRIPMSAKHVRTLAEEEGRRLVASHN